MYIELLGYVLDSKLVGIIYSSALKLFPSLPDNHLQVNFCPIRPRKYLVNRVKPSTSLKKYFIISFTRFQVSDNLFLQKDKKQYLQGEIDKTQ